MRIFISSYFKKHFKTYIDYLDHYWIEYFEKKKYSFQLIPNSLPNSMNLIDDIKKTDLIILPGGNDIFGKDPLFKTRLMIEKNLLNLSIKKKIPLFGVCRGMQVINMYFGGNMKKIKGHMNTKHPVSIKKRLFGKSRIIVNSFHNYGIPPKKISKKLEILATDKKGNIEMFKHKKFKILGAMWHPEREKNFKNLDKIIKELLK